MCEDCVREQASRYLGVSPSLLREYDRIKAGAPRPSSFSYFNDFRINLSNPATPATPAKPTEKPTPTTYGIAEKPTPTPTAYDVTRDVQRMAKEAQSANDAENALGVVAEAVESAKDALEERRLIEQALKPIAKLGKRNVQARRFVLAYRAISGDSMKTLEGVELERGKIFVADGTYSAVSGLSGSHASMAALAKSATTNGYYIATSYVDKD